MSTDVKEMNSAHGRDVAQLQNYIGHGCVASVKLLLLSFFRIYIWRSLLHYKMSVCCDVRCERRDLCALSEDIRYMHPNCSQIAFFSVYLSFASHAGRCAEVCTVCCCYGGHVCTLAFVLA